MEELEKLLREIKQGAVVEVYIEKRLKQLQGQRKRKLGTNVAQTT